MSATANPDGEKGCFYVVGEAPNIIQAACILKRTANRTAVEKFTAFLVSPEAKKIKMKFGYR